MHLQVLKTLISVKKKILCNNKTGRILIPEFFFQLHEPFHAEDRPVDAQHGFKNPKSSRKAFKEMVAIQILLSLRSPQPFNSDTKWLVWVAFLFFFTIKVGHRSIRNFMC
jgi:hypothetical protein